MKLTAKGEEQAQRLAALLQDEDLIPGVIKCGGLLRTKKTAEIIGARFALPVDIDSRLTELDYGAWSGLTTDEVRARFGNDEIDAWDRDGVMPQARGWQPSSDRIKTDIVTFAADVSASANTALAVTSNGVLRFFSTLVDGLFDELASRNELKVGTGNLCGLEHDGDKWRMLFWNRKP